MSKPRKRKAVYYAHAMCMYGHPAELFELQFIRASFPGHRIINPAAYGENPTKRRDVLGFCFRLVESSDGVVFSRLLGKITAGVGAEVNHALGIGKPVFELKTWRLSMEKWTLQRIERPVRFIARGATIALYREFESQ